VLRGTLPFGAYLYAFTSTGAFVAGGSADGALAISNASGATVRYQVLVTTTGAGAAGNYTLFSTAAGSGACPAAAALTMGQAATGAIQAGGCTLSNPFFSSSRPFTGAESGGKYFYNLYTIDVAPNTVATVTATRGTLPPGVYIYAFSTTGAFVSGSSPDGTLTINNSPNVTGTTVRYQVLVTTSTAGVTGTYTLNSSAVVGTPCPAPGRSFLPLTSGIFAGDCSLSIPFFSSNRPFNGPELGGTYFYRLFTGILVFDNSVATFTVARGTLPFAAYVYAFTSTGVYVAGGGADVPLTLTNFGPSQSYNLLVTTSEPGATGTFTLNSTSAPLCPAGLALLVGQTRTGTIQTGNCSLTDPVFSSSRPFKGPEMGGTYFYNLLSTDVAANSVATLTIARGTLPPGAYLYAFLPSGVYVAGGSADGALTINNTGGATQNYYVLVTTTAPGATGTYTLTRGPQ
jgi:hypothetical protein